MQTEFANFPTKENITDHWTAGHCMVMELPITALRCSNIPETVQQRKTQHSHRQSTMTLLKKRHQGILDD